MRHRHPLTPLRHSNNPDIAAFAPIPLRTTPANI